MSICISLLVFEHDIMTYDHSLVCKYLSSTFAGKHIRTQITSPASFAAVPESRNHYLNDGILKIEKRTSLMACMKKCEKYGTECLSFSIHEGKQECMLNNMVREDARKTDYVYEKGYVYYERV